MLATESGWNPAVVGGAFDTLIDVCFAFHSGGKTGQTDQYHGKILDSDHVGG